MLFMAWNVGVLPGEGDRGRQTRRLRGLSMGQRLAVDGTLQQRNSECKMMGRRFSCGYSLG